MGTELAGWGDTVVGGEGGRGVVGGVGGGVVVAGGVVGVVGGRPTAVVLLPWVVRA